MSNAKIVGRFGSVAEAEAEAFVADEDEDEDEDDVCPHMRATSDARWLVLFPGAAHASIISMHVAPFWHGSGSLAHSSISISQFRPP